MTTRLIPSNVLQKIQGVSVNRRDVALHPITYYTVPAGKKAKLKGVVSCTNTGAAATVDIIFAGVITFRWLNAGFVNNFRDAPRTLGATANQAAEFEVDLAAGETMVSAQNAGANAEINLSMVIIETPV